jgi:hypothetical protein
MLDTQMRSCFLSSIEYPGSREALIQSVPYALCSMPT